MKNQNTYKVRGKRWKLNLLKVFLYAAHIPCLHMETQGFLLVTINNAGELVVLQNACALYGLKYHQQ